MVEVYDSNEGFWRVLCTIPNESDFTALQLNHMVIVASNSVVGQLFSSHI